jgi:hypothetical protein
MNIYQASSATMNSDKGKRILAFILKAFPIFSVIEFGIEPFSFDTYPVKEDVGDTDNSAREINAAAKNFVYDPAKGGGLQKAYAFEHLIDKAYLHDLDIGVKTAEGLRRQIENEQLRLAKKVASDILVDVFGGLGSDTTILGLKTLIKDVADASGQTSVFGLTQAQIHSSLVRIEKTLALDNDLVLRQFEEQLIIELAGMGGDPVMIMNNYMYARMTSIAKKLSLYGQTTTAFGNKVDLFGNYRMVPVPLKYLPQTETDGTANDLSSIYLVEYNEADGVRIATNSGFYFVDFENLETKPSGKSRLEFIGNHKLEDMKKIKRLARIGL